MIAIRAFYANKKPLKICFLQKKNKMNIFKTSIRPVIMYSAKTTTMTKKKDEEDLRLPEGKTSRTIE